MSLFWVISLCCVFCVSHVAGESVPAFNHTNSSSVVLSVVVLTTTANFSAEPAASSPTPTLTFSASPNHSSIFPTPSPSIDMSSSMNYSITPIQSSSTSWNVSSLTITVFPTNHSASQIMPSSSHHIVPTLSPSGSVNSTATVMTSTVIPTSSPNGSAIISTAVMTTTVMPSSSVIPTPTPPPPFGNYTLKDNGTACLLASFSVKFDVIYVNKTDGKKVIANIQLPDEQIVKTNGFCEQHSGEGDQSFISLTWPARDPKYNFSILFATEKQKADGSINEPEGSWFARHLELNINATDNSDFRDAEVPEITVGISGEIKGLNAKYGHAVQCRRPITVSGLHNSEKTVNATVVFDSLEIQPFEVPKTGKFGEADDCDLKPTTKPTESSGGKKSSNTVAIAVGCTLAGLVVIVLIGYFIGRRRSSAKKLSAGYRKL